MLNSCCYWASLDLSLAVSNFPWLRLTDLPCMSWKIGFSLTLFISTAEREWKMEEGINRTEKIKIMFFSWTCGAWKFFEFLICESNSFSSEHVWANETQTANWSSFRHYLCQEKKICKKRKQQAHVSNSKLIGYQHAFKPFWLDFYRKHPLAES